MKYLFVLVGCLVLCAHTAFAQNHFVNAKTAKMVVDDKNHMVQQIEAGLNREYRYWDSQTGESGVHNFTKLVDGERVPLADDEYVLTIHFKDYILMKSSSHGNGVMLNLGLVNLSNLKGLKIDALNCVPETQLPHLDSLAAPFVEYNIYHHVMKNIEVGASFMTEPLFSTADCDSKVLGKPTIRVSDINLSEGYDGDGNVIDKRITCDLTVELSIQAEGKTHSIRLEAKELVVQTPG